MKIALAADHAGFAFKQQLALYLTQRWHSIDDFGAYELNPEDDYPDMTKTAIKSLLDKKNERAIIICTNGLGPSMVANRFDGVRASVLFSSRVAEATRRHHNSNVACIPVKEFDTIELFSWIDIWLATEFDGGRHQRRIDKINTTVI